MKRMMSEYAEGRVIILVNKKFIEVNGRRIGEGYPTYVIAEMSGNHAGSLERAKEIIHAAKESGADCIKIQTYTPDTLTIDCHNQYFRVQGGTWEGENLYGLYGKAYTPWEWQPLLKEEADKIGIDFLSTPFDKTSVDFLEELGLSFYKIASFEMIDLPLLRYVAEKGKPVIMSTGMGSLEEIKEAVEAVMQTGNKQLALLKCSSVYPADPAQMNLATIKDLRERFSLPIGLSDHSMGSLSATTAVALGASIIEKHFCISREIENPDATFSMTPVEFKQMIADIRNVEAVLGKPTYGVSKQEESSMIFRRSVFVVKDIAAGEKFTEENVRIIRPGFGVKPKYLPDILTMRAAVSMERGTPVSFDAMEKGAVLFLTNNENTSDLYEWLCRKEEKVYRVENKLTLEMVRQLAPAYMISFNYRHMIPKAVLDEMEGRVINLHTSYLPYNRGSSPNFFSFWEDTPKGVTIHKMDVGLDTGAILCQKELFFDENKETFASSYDTLMIEIKKLFRENWENIKSDRLTAREQVGEGTCHRMKDLEEIRNKYPFSWSDVIADVKEKCGVQDA